MTPTVTRRNRPLIIGVGNAYRSDDGAGVRTARKIASRVTVPVDVVEESGEGAALLERWRDVDLVYLIDAVATRGRPGCIYRFDACRTRIPSAFFRYSTHAFGVAEAIEVGRVLDALPATLIVFGIEGGRFEVGTRLSRAVRHAVNRVTDTVRQELLLRSLTDALPPLPTPGIVTHRGGKCHA